MRYDTGFVKYFRFILIDTICWILFFDKKLEWIGLICSYIIFLVSGFYLSKDIFNSPNGMDQALYIFIFSMLFVFVSASVLVITFYTLYFKYLKINSKIVLNSNDRSDFDLYKRLYVSFMLLITLFCIFFFSLSKNNEPGIYQDFFYYDIKGPLNIKILSLLIIKTILSVSLIGITSYMVYLSSKLYKLTNTQVYSSPENDYRVHKNDLSKNAWLFENINLNYLLNYKTEI